MFRPTVLRPLFLTALAFGLTCDGTLVSKAAADANPRILNYGWGQIVADPHYPIVDETATIAVTVHNDGPDPATNVQVKLSFNDWGVTFMGWQQMGATQVIPFIPPGGSAVASVTHVFRNRAHTCVEALIVGADSNTNLTDDRGQINLEVINSTDSFAYDVPVVNNGEGPLAVRINGVLFGREQGPVGEIPVEGLPPVLEIPPGEQVLVHVEVDLAAAPLPPGPVFLRIEAENLADPNDRNNVIFAIRRTTARQLKREAIAALQALVADMPTPAARNRAGNALGHVRQSVEPRFWKPGDENRLAKNGGAAVFAQEGAAVQVLESLMSAPIEQPLKVRIDAVIRTLADADRILAATAVADAGGDPDADAHRAEGDEARQQGRYREAIRDYGRAWGEAIRP